MSHKANDRYLEYLVENQKFITGKVDEALGIRSEILKGPSAEELFDDEPVEDADTDYQRWVETKVSEEAEEPL